MFDLLNRMAEDAVVPLCILRYSVLRNIQEKLDQDSNAFCYLLLSFGVLNGKKKTKNYCDPVKAPLVAYGFKGL